MKISRFSVEKQTVLFLFTTLLVQMAFIWIDPTRNYASFFAHFPSSFDASFSGFGWDTVLFLLSNFFFLSLFGWVFLRGFFSEITVSPIVQVLASLPFGYLLTVGLYRMVTLVFPHGHAYWPSLIVQMTIVCAFYYRTKTFNRPLKHWFRFSLTDGVLISLWVLTVLGTLLLSVEFIDFHVHGHGREQYLEYYLNLIRNTTHFPIIHQHYGEWLFNYVITEKAPGSFDPLLSPWFTHGVYQGSVIIFLYLAFKRLGMSTLMGAVSTSFLFFASFSLNPLRYHLLFDSGSPLAFVPTTDRVIGVLTLLLMTADFFCKRSAFLSKWFLFGVGLGLSTTSFSNSLFLVVFSIFFIVARHIKKVNTLLSSKVIVTFSIGGFLFTGLSYEFANHLDITAVIPPGLLLIPPVLILFGISIQFLLEASTSKSLRSCRELRRYSAFFLSTFFGFLLLGNIAGKNSIATLWITLINRLGFFQPFPANERISPHTQLFKQDGISLFSDHRELYGVYNSYCRGFLEFFSSYGLLLIFAVLGLYFLKRIEENNQKRFNHPLEQSLLFSILLFPFLFFLTDFFNAIGERAWVKTRLFELPFYMILISFFLASSWGIQSRVFSKLEKYSLLIFLVFITTVQTLVPMTVIQILKQFKINWGLFLEHV